MRHSIIYFIQAKDGGAIKIGISRQLAKRLQALISVTGRELRVLAVLDGGQKMEARLHKRFAHLRIAGGWFEPDDDLTAFIAREGRPWNDDDFMDGLKIVLHKDISHYVGRLALLVRDGGMTESDIVCGILRPILEEAVANQDAAEALVVAASESNSWAEKIGFSRRPGRKKPCRSRRIRDVRALMDRDIDILVLAACGRRRAEIARLYRITPSLVYRYLRQVPAEAKSYVARLVSKEAGATFFVLPESERAVIKEMILAGMSA